jgi:hypothetical protein
MLFTLAVAGLAGSVCADELSDKPRYGSVALVATGADEPAILGASVLAGQIHRALAQGRKISVEGKLIREVRSELSTGLLRSILRDLQADQIALIEFSSHSERDSSVLRGPMTVSLPLTEFEPGSKYVEDVSVDLRDERHTRSIQAAWQAAAWIEQGVSKGQVIAVRLILSTNPGEAMYRFGDSGPYMTNETGDAVWSGTRPEGKERLH